MCTWLFLISCDKVYFLFCSVHNADYYMQEAKKLKHKADALVSPAFLQLAALQPLYTRLKRIAFSHP